MKCYPPKGDPQEETNFLYLPEDDPANNLLLTAAPTTPVEPVSNLLLTAAPATPVEPVTPAEPIVVEDDVPAEPIVVESSPMTATEIESDTD